MAVIEPESASLVRSWRTAFLTIRDETLTHPSQPLSRILPLLDELIFDHFHSLIAASRHLPRYEVTSDLMYLLNLAVASCGSDEETEQALFRICHLILKVALRVSLEITSSSWSHMLELLSKLVKYFIESSVRKRVSLENSSAIKATLDCLEITRVIIVVDPLRCSSTDNSHLIEYLMKIVICCHSELDGCYHHGDARGSSDFGQRFSLWNSLWKVQTTAFAMIGEAFARVGSSLPIGTWQSVVEGLRKVMDVLTTRMSVVESDVMSRFYVSLLHCLHLVIVNRKGSLSDHVAAFVATLRMFLGYGLISSSMLSNNRNRDLRSTSNHLSSTETIKKEVGAYRPPHLRRKKSSLQQRQTQTSQTSSDHDSSPVELMSSDSDFSDSDVALRSSDNMRSCKARIAVMTCIQDLCEVDRKAFVAHWTMLLPTSDVLHPRKYDATLMTLLIFDPFLKARLASASTIASMLEGPSAVALQVAEYKERTKLGSYMALSSCLGHILMQLHSGVLHLVQHERHTGLLTSLFKILTLLISSTPYSRMPGELLPRVLSSLRLRVQEGFPFQNDQMSLLATALSCLTVAVSTSPSSLFVDEMFQAEVAAGILLGKGGSGVLITLFQHAEQTANPTLSLEALQAIKAVCHNYPNVMVACWKQISAIIYQFLRLDTVRVPSGKGHVGHDVVSPLEKVVTAAIKVMDECLRAVSGFKGTEDLLGDKLLETPFASECVREKKISSAPSYGSEAPKVSEDDQTGGREWCEALDKHLSLSICHPSGMVRAASVTCFAGITCSVFFSLGEQQQQFILSSCVNSAKDSVASVRSAACRAIGVVACFPEILRSSEILYKFINAVEVNTHDQLVSVRITASWAMANICDSFRHCVSDFSLDIDNANFQLLVSLLECALRLTRDGDKIKSNAIRALGNISRVIPFSVPHKLGNDVTYPGTSGKNTFSSKCCLLEQDANVSSSLDSSRGMHLLERIVQAFLSCITTGNVKVQWNACHALSNLFQNESLSMLHMDWASSLYRILILLLRDSPNFKIRIQAAAALAVPFTVLDYGSSFSDIVRGLEHILENVVADQGSSSNFKYRVALEKQLTASMLHVLGLCSSSCDELMKEFLLKKASFLEGWLKDLCLSLEASTHQEDKVDSYRNQKRDVVCKAIRALIDVYQSKNQSASAQKLQNMLTTC